MTTSINHSTINSNYHGDIHSNNTEVTGNRGAKVL